MILPALRFSQCTQTLLQGVFKEGKIVASQVVADYRCIDCVVPLLRLPGYHETVEDCPGAADRIDEGRLGL